MNDGLNTGVYVTVVDGSRMGLAKNQTSQLNPVAKVSPIG